MLTKTSRRGEEEVAVGRQFEQATSSLILTLRTKAKLMTVPRGYNAGPSIVLYIYNNVNSLPRT